MYDENLQTAVRKISQKGGSIISPVPTDRDASPTSELGFLRICSVVFISGN